MSETAVRVGVLPVDVLRAHGLPEEWQWVSAECIGGKPPAYTHVKYEGAVYEPVTRGKRKGQPNYRKPVAGTEATVVVAIERNANGT